MSFKVIEGRFGDRAPETLAADLRAMAAMAEDGRLTGFVGAYVVEGEYLLLWGASLAESLVLSTLLQDAAVDRFKR